MEPKMILVVCNGNIHRSVIAELCLNRELKRTGLENKIECVSRGLQGSCGTPLPTGKNLRDYPKEWSLTKPVLDRLGIKIPESQQSTPVDGSIIRKATVVLALDRGVLIDQSNSLIKQSPELSYKMRLFRELEGNSEDVLDCCGQDDVSLYEQTIGVLDQIARGRLGVLIGLAKLFCGSGSLFLKVEFSPKKDMPPESWGWCDLSIRP